MKRPLLKQTPLRWFIVLTLMTCALALGLPPSQAALQQLHISSLTYRLAVLSLLVPYIIIWFAGFYAWGRLLSYTKFLKRVKEGWAFRRLAWGTGVLAFGLVVPTAIIQVLKWWQQYNPTIAPVNAWFSIYSSIIVALVSFSLIGVGSRRLAELSRARYKLTGTRLLILFYILLGVSFTYLVGNNTDVLRSYHINTFLLLFTFITPYLFAWFCGLFSALELQISARYVKGILYKRALHLISYGLGITVLGSIALQFMNAAVPSSAIDSLWPLLLLEYVLLSFFTVGLVLMALGAKKLQMIEEV